MDSKLTVTSLGWGVVSRSTGATVLSFAKTAALTGHVEPASIKNLRHSQVRAEGHRVLTMTEEERKRHICQVFLFYHEILGTNPRKR